MKLCLQGIEHQTQVEEEEDAQAEVGVAPPQNQFIVLNTYIAYFNSKQTAAGVAAGVAAGARQGRG